MQRIKADTRTAGGIFLPDSAVKELNEAKVLAVGPGAMDKDGKRIAMGVAAGDKVLIPQVRDTLMLMDDWDGCKRGWTDNGFAVRRQPDQGRRGGVLPFPGSRVSASQFTVQHRCMDGVSNELSQHPGEDQRVEQCLRVPIASKSRRIRQSVPQFERLTFYLYLAL